MFFSGTQLNRSGLSTTHSWVFLICNRWHSLLPYSLSSPSLFPVRASCRSCVCRECNTTRHISPLGCSTKHCTRWAHGSMYHHHCKSSIVQTRIRQKQMAAALSPGLTPTLTSTQRIAQLHQGFTAAAYIAMRSSLPASLTRGMMASAVCRPMPASH